MWNILLIILIMAMSTYLIRQYYRDRNYLHKRVGDVMRAELYSELQREQDEATRRSETFRAILKKSEKANKNSSTHS